MFIHDIYLRLEGGNTLYLPAWGEEGTAPRGARFFRCTIEDPDSIEDLSYDFAGLDEALGELAAYYSATGTEFGSRPETDADGSFEPDELQETWDRWFYGLTGLPEEYDALARLRLADSPAARYVVWYVQRLCRAYMKGYLTQEDLFLQEQLVQAAVMCYCGKDIRELCLVPGTEPRSFQGGEPSRQDLRMIAQLLENSPELRSPGLERRLLIREIFSDPDLLLPLEPEREALVEQALDKAVASLHGLEKEIILDRFGLKDGWIKPPELLAGTRAMSLAQVELLLARGLRMLKHPNRSRPLMEVLGL